MENTVVDTQKMNLINTLDGGNWGKSFQIQN